jgi:signal transduction histidine kinase
MDTDAVSRLLSLTSHELRSPLGVIRGYLKWLEQQGATLPEQHRQVVIAAIKASDRLTDLLSELSALAQLQRGDIDVAREPLPLRSLVADTAAAFDDQPPGLVSLTASDLPDVRLTGDGALLQAALVSLATAVSLAQPRSAALVVRGHLETSGTPVLRLEIAAAGTARGVPEVALNLMRGGLGLRLAMAAEIVAVHGGRIAEQHHDGRLSGMIVWLPVTPG